ncbi:xanthine dehydrogenase family protein molybdopterin-binding subunit [Candidatus Izemoplasma sp. B36]|uniref:xanthine dehydrogenase family protein molybdopterin-binding subunit n=1 Tax=Candidatus Izemoplasma sp. B36 TaxID=3242468 RepID=UPI003557C746
MKDISKSIKKTDSNEKISGSATYVADIKLDGMLHAVSLRSSIAKGKIKEIHFPEIPEDYYIVSHKDIPGKNIVKIIFEDQKIFPVHTITYRYEPILLVVGPDKQKVVDIINQTKIEYIEETPVFDWVNSAIDYHFEKGIGLEAFKGADKVIKYDYETNYQEQAYIEPQGFIGYPEGDKVTLIGSIQCPYYVKNAVIQALNATPENVRVIQPSIGGAFGGKEEFPSLIACQLAVAVNKIKKPIQLLYERDEDMNCTTKRHPAKIHFEAAIKQNEIQGIKVYTAIDAGANIGLSGVVLSRALIACTGVYTIDNLDVSGDVFITNTVPNGAFRGFGAPQMFFAVEMFMEHIALDLNQDVLSFKRKYLAKQNDKTSTNGIFRDPVIMPKMIDKAMKVSDYIKKREAYNNESVYKGIGMSLFFHGCGFTGSGEKDIIKAKVKLRKEMNGDVSILVAAVDMGQGIRTTLRKVVANILEIPIEKVIFDFPDTDKVPDSGPTVASRTMMIVGGLIARACIEMKERWIEPAFTVTKQYKQPSYIEYDEASFYGDAYPAYSWGVNIVEVEVDKATYQVNLVNAWSVYDCGKAIDERIVLGQADGGLTQGLSYGYLEVMNHDKGVIKQKNMTDYIIPTAKDMCKMETIIYDNPYAFGPYGAKGVGELTLIGGAPAVCLAIEQAISRRIHKIPATPEYIMELVNHG